MDQIQHGGALDRAIATYGGERDDWLDLSTGINPNPCTLPSIPVELWNRLPEEYLLESCIDAARQFYDIPNHIQIVAAPGTQALIQLLPSVVRPQRSWIVGPTYGEYERVLSSNSQVVVAPDLPETVGDIDLIVVGIPNNPDGRVFDFDRLFALAQEIQVRGGMILVDAAFGDVLSAEQRMALSKCASNGIVVFRSFGKFFGLAGLRLGFAVGDTRVLCEFRSALGPWAVSGPALFIGQSAMSDTSWIDGARAQLNDMRIQLEKLLKRHGLNIIGATDLFVTASTSESASLSKFLARKHILARSFEVNPEWIRFGVPASAKELQRLEKVLAQAC